MMAKVCCGSCSVGQGDCQDNEGDTGGPQGGDGAEILVQFRARRVGGSPVSE